MISPKIFKLRVIKNIFYNSPEIDKFKEMEKKFTELIKVSSRRGIDNDKDNSSKNFNSSKKLNDSISRISR